MLTTATVFIQSLTETTSFWSNILLSVLICFKSAFTGWVICILRNLFLVGFRISNVSPFTKPGRQKLTQISNKDVLAGNLFKVNNKDTRLQNSCRPAILGILTKFCLK